MKPRFLPAFTALLMLVASAAQASAQSCSMRADAAYLFLRGVAAPAGGAGFKDPTASFITLIAEGREQLREQPALKTAVVVKAYFDALGRLPTDGELRAESDADAMYAERVASLVHALSSNPAEYAQVLDRAYRVVVGRSLYPAETEYWSKRKTMSFTFVAACLDSWVRRNQPGLMMTAGDAIASVNSTCLSTRRLTPEIAAEIAKAFPWQDATAAESVRIVSPGCAAASSAGGIAFVAVASPLLLDNTTARPETGSVRH